MDVEDLGPLCSAGVIIKGWATLENNLAVVLKWPCDRNSAPRYMLKRVEKTCLHKICSETFIATLFLMAKKCK